jgi:large subunit ribosomal protein L20
MRANSGRATRIRRKKIIKLAKGYRGQRHINFKVAKQQVWKSYLYAYRDRKNKKRDFRKIWIARINAAARMNGLSYSKFMHGLALAGSGLNRKMLADIAVSDFETFSALADQAKNALDVPAPVRSAATLETTVSIQRVIDGGAKAVVLTPDPSKKGQKQKTEKPAASVAAAKPAATSTAAEPKIAFGKPSSKSTIMEIKSYLDGEGIKYPDDAKKADLLKLVK